MATPRSLTKKPKKKVSFKRVSKRGLQAPSFEGWENLEAEKFHRDIEKSVKKKNMMTGKEFMEKVNTPYYCSPSSETYWSM